MKDANFPSIKEQLTLRKGMLKDAVKFSPDNGNLNKLLSDVDAALEEMAEGTYGICTVCNDPIETERLLADPLMTVCLPHLSDQQQRALEDDLEYAGKDMFLDTHPPDRFFNRFPITRRDDRSRHKRVSRND